MFTRRWVVAAIVASFAAAGITGAVGSSIAATATPSATALHVRVLGKQLVDQDGSPYQLRGVNRGDAAYSCVQNKGVFDSPADALSVAAMLNWNINAVRLPLNEACWNGSSYVPPAYAGANYQAAIKQYVSLLNSNGIVVILDLHFSEGLYTGPGTQCSSDQALCQKPMPDAAQAVPFWDSVARTFENNGGVVFDLFNEPFPDKALPTLTDAWQCLHDGGSACSAGISYPVAGMQTLVDTVRGTGALNVVVTGGLTFSNYLTSDWLTYKPTDPVNQLVASWHSYNFNACVTQACWDSQVAPVLAAVPLIAGEIGENDCAHGYIDPLMAWLDARSTSYLAWAWNVSSCAGLPSLITDTAGRPTAYGQGYQAHLLTFPAVNPGGCVPRTRQ